MLSVCVSSVTLDSFVVLHSVMCACKNEWGGEGDASVWTAVCVRGGEAEDEFLKDLTTMYTHT